MTDFKDDQQHEDGIRRDSNGTIDYRYYQLRGRQVRAEAVWLLLQRMFGGGGKGAKNRQ